MNVKYPHQFSSQHREDILESETCGCFCCVKKFDSTDIVDWVDKDEKGIGQTALCPLCGIDSVIGNKSIPITTELLVEMEKYWF
jgi:hypothetical protein